MVDKPRVKMPNEARKGDIVVIKTLIAHPMESGFRKDGDGKLVPRKIISHFACSFNEQPVFACDFEPSVSANPYIQFTARVEGEGTFRFAWTDDDGTVFTTDQPMRLIG